MAELIAVVSVGKGTWDYLNKLVDSNDWSKIILIGNEMDLEKFMPCLEAARIKIDFSKKMPELVKQIKESLARHISGTEVALNMISGTGKEHMAVLSACLKSGVGIRLVAYSQGEFIEI